MPRNDRRSLLTAAPSSGDDRIRSTNRALNEQSDGGQMSLTASKRVLREMDRNALQVKLQAKRVPWSWVLSRQRTTSQQISGGRRMTFGMTVDLRELKYRQRTNQLDVEYRQVIRRST